MATITGLTAERMQEIIDGTIIGAHMSGDNLILELEGGGTIDAGDVRGPEGTPGAAPVGSVIDYAGSTAPTGWLMCDGSAVSRSTYADLFVVISTTFGAGNGTTTFNVPDTKGRTTIGAGTGSGLTARTRGSKVGEETHLLTTPEIPSHSHAFSGGLADGGPYDRAGGTTADQPYLTSATGGGGAHNNMQPSLVLNKIIKV